jgi:lysozyme family protein
MQHPYDALRGEYLEFLSKLTITRANEARERAKEILPLKPRYQTVSDETKVPTVMLMALNERESGSNLRTYLGNGQRLDRVTTLVPKGRGPWSTFEAGCVDAFAYEHLIGLDWSDGWPFVLYHEEAWNGFGPRDRGKPTGYLYAGTNIYTGGKYVADGIWNSTFNDPQLGTIPIMLALMELDKFMSLPGWPKSSPWLNIPELQKPPVGHDGGDHGVSWLQTELNAVQDAGLAVDGSYGRFTRMAVRQFQAAHGLDVDGLAGPLTLALLEKAVTSRNNLGASS